MSRFFEIKVIALSLGLGLTTFSAALHADDAVAVKTVKPHAAMIFNVGAKHGVGYFTSAEKQCRLVLTVADEPDWAGIQTFTATRLEADIPDGAATRYNSTDGKALEFTCHADAREMSFREVERVVSK